MATKPSSSTSSKKAPQQTLKEKRAAKRSKNEDTGFLKGRKGA